MAKKYDNFLDEILGEFGEAVVVKRDEDIRAISTGSISLDASIGIGGIPRGKITEIFGSESTGKTTTALSCVKTVIHEGGKVLYIDVENVLNFKLLKNMLGEEIPEDRLVILTAEDAESALYMAELGIKHNEYDLIVIDSIGALVGKVEKEETLSKETMAVVPRIVTRFLKRIVFDINFSKTALLILNQVRANVGSYTKGYTTPGGFELRHLASVRITLNKGAQIKAGEDIIGIDVPFTIRKNKLAPPFRSFHFPIIFGKGIDSYTDLVTFCSMLGVIQKAGSYYKFEGETLGQGKKATAEYLEGNKETLDKIKEMVYNVLTQKEEGFKIDDDFVSEPDDEGEIVDG